jgi:hypothetical protein
MTEHVEERIIYGRIYTQGLAFDLLSLEPQKTLKRDVPRGLRDGVEVFLVADADGSVKQLWASHWSGFVIIPQEPILKALRFELVEGDDVAEINSRLGSN